MLVIFGNNSQISQKNKNNKQNLLYASILPVFSVSDNTNILTEKIEQTSQENQVVVTEKKKENKNKIDLKNTQNVKKILQAKNYKNAQINLSKNGNMNFYNSVCPFYERGRFVQRFRSIVSVNTTKAVGLHKFDGSPVWDHTIQSPLWNAINLDKKVGSATARPQQLHEQITLHETVLLPRFCGYTDEKGSMYDWVIHQGDTKKKAIYTVYLAKPELLNKYGLTLNDCYSAIDVGIAHDLLFFKAFPIPENKILPVTDCIQILDKTSDECHKFCKNIMPGKSLDLDVEKATDVFVRNFKKTRKVQDFYHSLFLKLKEGSLEQKMITLSYSRFVNNAQLAIETLNEMGGLVTDSIKKELLEPTINNSLTWDELEIMARITFKLENRKGGLSTVWYQAHNLNKQN